MKVRIANRRFGSSQRSALTLLELVVVMVVLVALAGMTIPMFDSVASQSQGATTLASLRQLQTLILNTYVPNMKGADITAGMSTLQVNPDGLPRGSATALPMLVWLFQNPAATYGTVSSTYGTVSATTSTCNPLTHLGWNGPYLTSGLATYPGLNSNAASNGFTSVFGTASNSTTGIPGDPTAIDGWGNPIVIVNVHDQTSSSYYYVLLSAGTYMALDSTFSQYPATPAVPITITIDPATALRSLTTSSGSTTYHYPYWLPLQ